MRLRNALLGSTCTRPTAPQRPLWVSPLPHCMLSRACGLQATDTSVVAREHAARAANQLYSQAADQAAVARDQAAQALGEGIDRVRPWAPCSALTLLRSCMRAYVNYLLCEIASAYLLTGGGIEWASRHAAAPSAASRHAAAPSAASGVLAASHVRIMADARSPHAVGVRARSWGKSLLLLACAMCPMHSKCIEAQPVSAAPCFLTQSCAANAQVRNASTEDINRSRLARGAAMATLLWVVCAVLGIPIKVALTLAFMAVGGMMLKEFAAGRTGGPRVGGRGPHGGVRTTVRWPEHCRVKDEGLLGVLVAHVDGAHSDGAHSGPRVGGRGPNGGVETHSELAIEIQALLGCRLHVVTIGDICRSKQVNMQCLHCGQHEQPQRRMHAVISWHIAHFCHGLPAVLVQACDFSVVVQYSVYLY